MGTRGGDEITLEPLRPRTFDKTSPVTAYWLPRCDGFQVVGGRREAVVEGAVYDDDPLHPVALRVRVGHDRRRLIPIEAVEAVCPLARTLYVRRPPSAAARAGVGVAAIGSGVGRHVGRGGQRAGHASAAAWRFSAPRVGLAAGVTARAARRQWPHVRRGAVTIAEAAFFLALALGSLLVSASIAVARLLRHSFVEARYYAPRSARAARTSAVRTSRTVAAEVRRARVRRTTRAATVEPLTDEESVKLLDHPLRADMLAMSEQADIPPADVASPPSKVGLEAGSGR